MTSENFSNRCQNISSLGCLSDKYEICYLKYDNDAKERRVLGRGRKPRMKKLPRLDHLWSDIENMTSENVASRWQNISSLGCLSGKYELCYLKYDNESA